MTIMDGHARTAAARGARTRAKHERWAAEMMAAGWRVAAPNTGLTVETELALKNYVWLAEHRDSEIDWYSRTVTMPNGGIDLDSLADPGSTPATR